MYLIIQHLQTGVFWAPCDLSSIDWVVSVRGMSLRSSGNNFQPVPRVGGSTTGAMEGYLLDLGDINKVNNQIQIIKGSAQTVSKLVIILEYTKTT